MEAIGILYLAILFIACFVFVHMVKLAAIGLKSVRYVAKKYGGNLTLSATGEKFVVDIIIPVPRAKK